jgi:Xaa-Pro aminopeptidase
MAYEYETRLKALYYIAGVDWVLVYGDREHFGNLTYLTNLDPRFEEALLLLGPAGRRVLILGNECMGYTSVVPVEMEFELCQTLSLMAQKRDAAPRLYDVLKKIGVESGQSVGMVGWKYLEPEEWQDPDFPAFLPAYFVEVARAVVGPKGKITDVTRCLMHSLEGLRAVNSAGQIAAFEWAARNCSASVFTVLQNARPGMTERAAMRNLPFSGDPFTMHPILSTGSGAINGLRSPGDRVIQYGDAANLAVGFWGSLVCRAGQFLGEPDQAYFETVATPYYKAIAAWYQNTRLGAPGGEIFQAVARAFEGSGLQSMLNPGHLTSHEEWLHSPIRPGSAEEIRSGMVFQVDIIPTPLGPGHLINCEDTVAVADEALRAEIRAAYPQMWGRIQARRRLMTDALGLTLAEELLPLSDGTAYLPPFWLMPESVCTVSPG